MAVSDSIKSLLSTESLVRRASARVLSDMAESDPSKFKEDDLAAIIKVLREEDDSLTLEFLLKVIDFAGLRNLTYLINAGLLRVLVDVYMRNMGGIGVPVGRNAMRLISTLASADIEGAEKLDVIGLDLRAITGSSDPYVRWYASMGLRKLDPSLIRKGSPEIVDYCLDALTKESDDKVRIAGALTLSLVASLAPEALDGNDAIKTIIKTMLKDPNSEVQEMAAMTLQFLARRDPSRLRDTKIGEALCETVINKLESLKKNDNRADREVLVSAASTISILAMRDLSTLTESKGIEEINIAEIVTSALAESAEETDVRPILLSILLELSNKAARYVNNKRIVSVLADLLDKGDEADTSRRSAISILDMVASIYPTLFADSLALERIVSASLKSAKLETSARPQHGPSPIVVLDTLVSSEKGYRVAVAGLQRLHKEKPYLVSEICEARNWKGIMSQIKGEPVAETKIEKPPTVASTTPVQRAVGQVATERKEPEPTEVSKEEKRKPAPSTRLNDEQKAMLQEIFNTYAEIPLTELAQKLNVDENIIREVLGKLIGSGKLPYKIQDDRLYLKKVPTVRATRRERSTLCIWCGAELGPMDERCPNCNKTPPKCLICNAELTTEDELEKCPFCGTLFHREHYRKWVEKKKHCPKCSVAWS
ncbi:MAG: HEAT repeat domain-containing protein [Promethearchaeati archaeon SRVP18_Atabeyarchaeia-1]